MYEGNVGDKWTNFLEALAHGNEQLALKHLMDIQEVKSHALATIVKDVQRECSNICKRGNKSLFRDTSPESLAAWSYEKQELELNKDAPTFLTILQAAGTPTDVAKNKQKTNDVVRGGLMGAAGVVFNTRNKSMIAHQMQTALILKQSGAGEKAFRRLGSRFMCVDLVTANRLLDRMCVGYDLPVRNWAMQMLSDAKEEKRLMSCLAELEGQVLEDATLITNVQKDLHQFNATRHPGFQLVGDNVDVRVNVRQMRIGHQNQDLHHFNFLAIKNRVQIHHLPNDRQVCPSSDFEPGMVLPNASDNSTLKNNWTILTARIIAEHCPELAWFKDNLPEATPHAHRKEAAQRSEVVS